MRFLCLLIIPTAAFAACLPAEEAAKHVGETTCVHGRIVTVSAQPGGTHVLEFCGESGQCGFSAVVFARDLPQVGDVRSLAGEEVDIQGKIRLYHGHPEVIVHDARQFKGEAAKLPPIPKSYDVANRGRVSPGQRPTHSDRTPKAKYPRHGAETIEEPEPEP